jgi:hypothetical protein
MIVSRIQGGLGNQMFQYAFGYNLSKKYDLKLFIDKSFYSNQGNVIRYFNLDYFEVEINDISQNKFLINRPFTIISDLNYFVDHKLNSRESYYLDGYWQSEKFFKDYTDDLRKIFKMKTTDSENFCIENNLGNSETISIHVRRGDYVGSEDYHPTQNLKYYENAIDELGTYEKVLIFSDDMEWCKENFKFDRMIFCEGFKNVEDLMIMSQCKNNIISNSSFSWWAAYLNNNIEKKIIAPKLWYGSKMNIETKDLVPENWIRI